MANTILRNPVTVQIGGTAPARLPGQWLSQVDQKFLTSQEAHIDYSACARALVVAGPGSNYLEMNATTSPNRAAFSYAYAATDVLTWRMIGQTSGWNQPIGQDASTLICTTGAATITEQSKLRGGARSNPGVDPDTWVHEQYVELTRQGIFRQWAARRFNANTPNYVAGEQVLFTEF